MRLISYYNAKFTCHIQLKYQRLYYDVGCYKDANKQPVHVPGRFILGDAWLTLREQRVARMTNHLVYATPKDMEI